MKKDLSKFLDFKQYKQTKGEKYMSPKQIEHFKKILLDWKNLLMKEAEKTVENMKRDSTKLSDPNDAATQEEEFRLELRTRDRERKLIIKIDQALQRVDDGRQPHLSSMCRVSAGTSSVLSFQINCV